MAVCGGMWGSGGVWECLEMCEGVWGKCGDVWVFRGVSGGWGVGGGRHNKTVRDR